MNLEIAHLAVKTEAQFLIKFSKNKLPIVSYNALKPEEFILEPVDLNRIKISLSKDSIVPGPALQQYLKRF